MDKRAIPKDRFGRFSWKKDPNDFRTDPRVPRIKFKCKECNKIRKFIPWQLKTTGGSLRKFCSRKCWQDYVRKNTLKGEKHWAYKGGRFKIGEGYIELRYWKDGKPIRILEHRKIMEEYLKRKLSKNELIHHKNGIKSDNRIDNLQIVMRKLHKGEVRCPYCLKDFAIK